MGRLKSTAFSILWCRVFLWSHNFKIMDPTVHSCGRDKRQHCDSHFALAHLCFAFIISFLQTNIFIQLLGLYVGSVTLKTLEGVILDQAS